METDVLDDLKKVLGTMTPKARAKLVITHYMAVENVSDELRDSFIKWLCCLENRKDKDAAMWEYFEEI